MFNKYYQDELQFLREMGEEFAHAHPGVAHYLSGPSRDPEVERMLEGFAFLAARVRQKLDDEFPELTHGLVRLLWPHYLRPVPSMAILEFTPVLQALRQSQTIARGCEVQSVEVEETACRFRTCHDVQIHPLSLEEVAMETRLNGTSRLRLSFKFWNQAQPKTLKLDHLRLFLHGDPAVSTQLYYHLLSHVEEVRAVAGPAAIERGEAPFARLSIEAAGFAEDEALLPYPAGSHPAYRYLQEYFSLPERYLFVDLHGLAGLKTFEVGERFTVDVRFDRALTPALRPTREDVRLYCAPIVNLFPHDGDPIRLDRTQSEYRLRPAGKNTFHYEVFSLERVRAFAAGAAEEQEIPDFYSFQDGGGKLPESSFFARQRPSVVDERLDTYVSFVDAHGVPATLAADTVSFELICTNRRLPEGLRVGDVQVQTNSSPAFVQFRNITAPTPSVAPPLGTELQWRLISHLSRNYVTLVDIHSLRGVLELYNTQALRDPKAARANALRLEGLHEIRSETCEALVHGALVRGTAITLDVLEDRFAGDGDLFLFATLLNEFLALHGTLNSFTQLSVHGLQKGEVMSWPHRIGRDLL